MHDDGARDRPAAAEPPAEVLRWTRWLRLALVVQAVRWVAIGLNWATPFTGTWLVSWSTSSTLVGIVLALLWLRWINACRQHLIVLGRRPSSGSLGVVWGVAQLVPFLGWVLRARVLYGLVADVDPRQLPPVTEEREQEGGFRQSSVVRVELGSVARPLFPLWAAVTGLSVAILGLAWGNVSTPSLATSRIGAQVAGGLLAVHLVGAVTHNLGELQRRLLAR